MILLIISQGPANLLKSCTTLESRAAIHTNYPLLNYARSPILDKEAEKLGNYLTESVNLLCTLSRWVFHTRLQGSIALVILLKEPRGLWPLHLLAFKIMQIVRKELKILKMFSNCMQASQNKMRPKTPGSMLTKSPEVSVMIFADKCPSFKFTYCVYHKCLRRCKCESAK